MSVVLRKVVMGNNVDLANNDVNDNFTRYAP
jgi:hypothetical protein